MLNAYTYVLALAKGGHFFFLVLFSFRVTMASFPIQALGTTT
jgi:hypothetical protein